jgi:CHAT domain-containing protein/Tfp pilus assembly protein PilF
VIPRAATARRAAAAALIALGVACAPRPGRQAAGPDALAGPFAVVVDEVGPGFAADSSGLRPGDVLVAWEARAAGARRRRAAGVFRSPFDALLVEVREAARGPVVLHARRGEQPFSATLVPDTWELHVRPAAPAVGASALELAWRRYAEARAAARARDWERANRAFAAAVEAAGPEERSLQAVLEREAGFALGRQARLAESRRWHERALRHREAIDPNGVEVAHSLLDLAIVARLLNELDAADLLLQRARGILEKEGPRSHVMASVLSLLGFLEQARGDLAGSVAFEERALAIREEFGTGPSASASLHNLGDLSRRRGDYVRAEDYYRRALAIKERLAEDRRLAYTLLSLGHVQRARGDLDAAQAAYERALGVVGRHGPDATAEAALEVALGDVALERRDEKGAEDRFRSALAVYRAVAPAGPGTSATLLRLGDLARARRRFGEAETLHRESLALAEKAAPGGPDAGRASFHLGEDALEAGRLEEAERRLRRALDVQERAAPETAEHAEVLHRLGIVLWRGGRREAAAASLGRAVTILDAQPGRLGGPEEAAARFKARYLRIYRDAMELLVELGRPSAAFDVLERSRAVALRQMLARRDLDLGRDLPPELEARRRSAAAEHDRLVRQLAELPASSPRERVHDLWRELRAAGRRRQQVQAEVRGAAPRLAALGHAPTLSAAEAAATLPAGTVALSYAVGPRATHVFVLEPGGRLDVARIGAGEGEIAAAVERFRLLLAAPGPGREAREGLKARGRELYRLLLAPIEPALAAADALLVVPDGPLHVLPFAATVRSGPEGGEGYLAEWKPLHLAASFTVRARLDRGLDASGRLELIAFGDPARRASDGAGGAEHLASAAGPALLGALPGSRREVQAVSAPFGGRARTFLGARATEQQVKAAAPGARRLHFAVHGLADDRQPLDSGLVLAPEGDGAGSARNGFLQAWEVVENVRLDAELVTLSACETALGTTLPGEGILGLTSAFQYAGARSVLASLWRVSDDSTAALMERFYGHLARGTPAPQALRAAQVELIRGPVAGPPRPRGSWFGFRRGYEAGEVTDVSHPFHWAAFELTGAPR